mgnify:CR=1 FL=1
MPQVRILSLRPWRVFLQHLKCCRTLAFFISQCGMVRSLRPRLFLYLRTPLAHGKHRNPPPAFALWSDRSVKNCRAASSPVHLSDDRPAVRGAHKTLPYPPKANCPGSGHIRFKLKLGNPSGKNVVADLRQLLQHFTENGDYQHLLCSTQQCYRRIWKSRRKANLFIAIICIT